MTDQNSPASHRSEPRMGIVIVDHGSKRAESNLQLLEVVELFRQQTGPSIVEPAHMELAEPSIQTAFDRCVQQQAELIVINPFFLSPGRHWVQDIPRLAGEAAARHPHVRYLITAPLGVHTLLVQLMQHRIDYCLKHALSGEPACNVCDGTSGCAATFRTDT